MKPENKPADQSRPWLYLDTIGEKSVELPVVLEDETLVTRSKELGLQIQEIEDTKERHKTVKAELREELRDQEAERNRLARIVREGREPRQVVCVERADYKAGQVYVVRTDTDELVRARRMTHDERQLGLDAVLNLRRNTTTDEETGEVSFRTDAEERFERGERPVKADPVGDELRAVQVALDAGDLQAAKAGLRTLVTDHHEDKRVELMVERTKDLLGNLATETADDGDKLPPEAGESQDADTRPVPQDRQSAAAGDDTQTDGE